MKRLMFALMALAVASVTSAQTAVWDHADFATASYYEIGYFALPVLPTHLCDLAAAPGAEPTVVENVGKPATTTGLQMSAPLATHRPGCWVIKARVLDLSGLYSPWSGPSDGWASAPLAPSKLVKR